MRRHRRPRVWHLGAGPGPRQGARYGWARFQPLGALERRDRVPAAAQLEQRVTQVVVGIGLVWVGRPGTAQVGHRLLQWLEGPAEVARPLAPGPLAVCGWAAGGV